MKTRPAKYVASGGVDGVPLSVHLCRCQCHQHAHHVAACDGSCCKHATARDAVLERARHHDKTHDSALKAAQKAFKGKPVKITAGQGYVLIESIEREFSQAAPFDFQANDPGALDRLVRIFEEDHELWPELTDEQKAALLAVPENPLPPEWR